MQTMHKKGAVILILKKNWIWLWTQLIWDAVNTTAGSPQFWIVYIGRDDKEDLSLETKNKDFI